MSESEIPKGISVVKSIPVMGRKSGSIDWFAIKQEYLNSPKMTAIDVSRKFGISDATIRKHLQQEGWAKDRRILWAKVDSRSQDIQVEKLAQLTSRHALIGKLLQKKGVEAIKGNRVRIKTAKDALEYAREGVRMEREAEGLDRQAPQIVNIVGQQQGIIDKYSK